jgi:hypothetical protein
MPPAQRPCHPSAMQMPLNARLATIDVLLETTIPLFLAPPPSSLPTASRTLTPSENRHSNSPQPHHRQGGRFRDDNKAHIVNI